MLYQTAINCIFELCSKLSFVPTQNWGIFLILNTVIVGANCVRPYNWAKISRFRANTWQADKFSSKTLSSPLRVLRLFSCETHDRLEMGQDPKRFQNRSKNGGCKTKRYILCIVFGGDKSFFYKAFCATPQVKNQIFGL